MAILSWFKTYETELRSGNRPFGRRFQKSGYIRRQLSAAEPDTVHDVITSIRAVRVMAISSSLDPSPTDTHEECIADMPEESVEAAASNKPVQSSEPAVPYKKVFASSRSYKEVFASSRPPPHEPIREVGCSYKELFSPESIGVPTGNGRKRKLLTLARR